MKTYSFKQLAITVSGVEMSGFAAGDDVFQARQRNDSAADEVGADGKMLVAISGDQSGEIVFRMQQSSTANAHLLALLASQQSDTPTPVVVSCRDLRSGEVINGVSGYIKKPADVSRGAGVNSHEWTIVVERIDFLPGFTA